MAAEVTGEHADFYVRLRERVETWSEKKLGENAKYAEWVLLAPDLFHLLTRLVVDPEVPAKNKAILGAAIAYFVSPIDLLPEALIGPIGLADDVGLAAYAINRLINDGGAARVRHHWAGNADVLEVVKDVVRRADDMLGSGLAGRLRGLVKGPNGSRDTQRLREVDVPDDIVIDAEDRKESPT